MSVPITLIRDDFENAVIDSLWATTVSGSATVAETGGQARFTLPSSTAGTHHAEYASTATYDLTGGSLPLTVGTMVATGVSAFAFLDLRLDGANYLRIIQQLNTIYFQKAVAGVLVTLFSAAWSATTYKYWRIRETGGTTFWDSSSDGTSWTNRASVANPFAITVLSVVFGAECGNVAAPGSFRVDDLNGVLPAPSATWRETTADWQISNRLRSVTLASSGNCEGVIVVADTMDSSRVLSGNLHYYAGPLGSSSGGYLQLTEYAGLALAQTSAFQLPTDGRVDLTAMRDARYMRLYHRSTNASAHTIYEYMPRRLVQADDIEAESIRAINIAAGAITADKIFVVSLSAITASMGALHMDGPIDITSGSLTGGGGTVILDTSGLGIIASTSFASSRAYTFRDTTTHSAILGGMYGQGNLNALVYVKLEANALANASNGFAQVLVQSISDGTQTAVAQVQAIKGATTYTFEVNNGTNNNFSFSGAPVAISAGLNVGSATSAGTGEIRSSGAHHAPRSSGTALYAIDGTSQGSALSIVNNGTAQPFGGSRVFSGLIIISETAINGNAALFLVDGGGTVTLVGAAGATWSVTAATASKTNVYITGSVVTIENKLGSTATYNIMALRTRTT